nr:uncharacterized protein LOC104119584 [Nicotiana tomentosiformis]
MRNIKEARFPKLIRSDPSQRDPNLWCEFHGTHGHRTRGCRYLHEEVATLLKKSDSAKNNYDRNWDNTTPSNPKAGSPRMTINMIFGGDEVNGVTFSAIKKMKILVTYGKRIREVSKDEITFTEEDADGLLLPHNDALAVDTRDEGCALDLSLLKFSTPEGIKQIRGDQLVAMEINVVTISSSKDRETSK